jgi:phosphoesterase RecJ-like protein
VALYVALMTETGSFRFSNTTPDVHRLVADLMDTGIQPHEVYSRLYENKPGSALGLTGWGLANMQVAADGKIVYTVVGREVFDRYQAVAEDADGLVNQILALETAEIAILVYDRGGGEVKVSFRAKNDADVQVLASKLGGGGHRKAAGATLRDDLDAVAKRVVGLAEAAVVG